MNRELRAFAVAVGAGIAVLLWAGLLWWVGVTFGDRAVLTVTFVSVIAWFAGLFSYLAAQS